MVSVIVPVYNVERYLRQCLDSLKAQTLKDTEFIIIDDGSTDGSGQICDEYGNDPRFRIIHTENRGLSAARNRGIDECNGEWIMFVDSDDWVEPGFCEIPLKAALENNADLVIFQLAIATETGQVKKGKKRDITYGQISPENAIDYGYIVVWNKFFRRQLLKQYKFPKGHVYEDLTLIHKLVYLADRIVLLPDTLIIQRNRRDSITHSLREEYRRDCFIFSLQRYDDLVQLGYSEIKARIGLQNSALKYCMQMHPSDEDLYRQAEKILSEAVEIPSMWHWKEKVMLLIWKINPKCFHILCTLLGMKIKL